jgi:hypothetical protein
MSASMAIELPCYTIINIPQDQEQPSEQKLKEDLEKGDLKVFYSKTFPPEIQKSHFAEFFLPKL